MMRAQGALEYLIIIAAVLGISAVVVLFVGGAFIGSSGGADLSKCRLAAANCQRDLTLGLGTSCTQCDAACKDSSGKDLIDSIAGCGAACSECKKGNAINQGSSPTIGLVADFKLDEGSGTTTASGGGQTGTLLLGTGNLMANPGFESGVWGNVGDCWNALCTIFPGAVCTPPAPQQSCTITGGTCTLGLATSTDKVEGSNSLSITSAHSGACTSKTFVDWTAGKQYTLGFWYKHVTGTASPQYYLQQCTGGLCTPSASEALTAPAQKDGNWHQHIKTFTIQIGTTAESLFLYAITDSSFTQSNELYDNVQISEGPIWASGKSGNALYFDGTDDYVEALDADSFSPSSFTINAWIKWDGVRYSQASSKDFAAIVSKGSFGNPTSEFSILMNRNSALATTTLNFYIAGGMRATWGNSQVDTNWHMVTFTYDGTNAKIYFDGGTPKVTTPATLTVPNSANKFRIGAESGGGYQWGGSIDEVKFFSRALADQEIAQLFS